MPHITRLADATGLQLPVDGRILDAGCGPGADVAVIAEAAPDALVVGMDFNDDVGVAAVRSHDRGNTAIVRGSVLEPPLVSASFDLVYSYGVLHHTTDPRSAFLALADLVRPGGSMAIYVYSDLREEPLLKSILRAVSAVRRVTTRLPPRLLLAASKVAAPAVWLVFGVPALVLRMIPSTAPIADKLPFNFITTPFGAAGDLYDRFSAPIEHRHAAEEVLEWYRSAGMAEPVVIRMPGARGWAAVGERPSDIMIEGRREEFC